MFLHRIRWRVVDILCRVLLQEIVKTLPAFCRTRRFITAFTRARHLSLSCARSVPKNLSRAEAVCSIPLRVKFYDEDVFSPSSIPQAGRPPFVDCPRLSSSSGTTAQGGPWPPSRVSASSHGCEQSFSYSQLLLHLLPPGLPILT